MENVVVQSRARSGCEDANAIAVCLAFPLIVIPLLTAGSADCFRSPILRQSMGRIA
jgi:hypothetical protein